MLQLPTINHLVESPIPQILPSTQEHQPVAIGEGLPPIPGKLVKKIESGLYIELSELLPDNLSVTNATGDIADAPKASKPVTRPTLSIIEWVQSFGIYTAILSKSQPHRVADLLGYQTLILQAHQEFQGDFWLRYDRTFRQKAATLKNTKWATIDTTLWSLAFSGRGRSGSLNERNRDQGPPKYGSTQSPRQPPVCFKWNRDVCTFRNCKFLHKCSYCIMDPGVVDASHKATNCPFRPHPDYHPLPLPQDKYPIRKVQ